uniref:Immunoglobulin domain-containing protein n=1 Tax=Scophthalmus maximus TaxID=52904 RepID=A0A8D3DI03_SCOMX
MIILLITQWGFLCLCVGAPVWQTAHLGGSVTINCTYPREEEGPIKYFCRQNEDGENPFNCSELIHTEEGEIDATEGRLYIRDSKRSKYFYVNINNLRTSDSGTYWCSFGRGRPVRSGDTSGHPGNCRCILIMQPKLLLFQKCKRMTTSVSTGNASCSAANDRDKLPA